MLGNPNPHVLLGLGHESYLSENKRTQKTILTVSIPSYKQVSLSTMKRKKERSLEHCKKRNVLASKILDDLLTTPILHELKAVRSMLVN